MRVALFICCVCSIGSVFTQGYTSIGTRQEAMGSVGLTLASSDAYFYNPAATGAIDKIEIISNYRNRYLLPEFSEQSLSTAFQVSKGVFSAGMYHAGYRFYQNTRIGIGYAMPLAKGFYIGIQANYQNLKLTSYYGQSHTATGEMGLYYKSEKNWSFGAAVFNLSNTRLSTYQDDRYKTQVRIGAGFHPSQKVNIFAEINKDLEAGLYLNSGIEYLPTSSLSVRFGISTGPSNFSFGFGYRYKSFTFNLASQYLPVLGFVPQVGVRYVQSKNK